MYQAPTATQTRPDRATQSPRPRWQLAGRQVTQTMFYDAEKAKRAGRRVFFVTAGGVDVRHDSDDCRNCDGFGSLCLEVVMGGPFDSAPAGRGGDAETAPELHTRPAWHNGSWWSVTRQMYPCPVCREVVKL